MKLLLYCTKAKPYLVERLPFNEKKFYQCRKKNDYYSLNGTIVAECDYEVEKLQIVYGKGWETKTIKGTENIEKLTCLSRDKLYQYCKGNGYAIHIKNLHIFDEPRDLRDYFTEKPYKDINEIFTDEIMIDRKWYRPVNKAPQNMMKVCEWDIGDKVLISIQPQWLCKILNGEKTIEVRKKVLKEMLNNEITR